MSCILRWLDGHWSIRPNNPDPFKPNQKRTGLVRFLVSTASVHIDCQNTIGATRHIFLYREIKVGFTVKFNWVLQIKTPDSLEVNLVYPFEKAGNRVFPIDTAIDLIDLDRNAIAKIKILSFLNERELTTGSFKVIKIYSGNEKAVLSNYWLENALSIQHAN